MIVIGNVEVDAMYAAAFRAWLAKAEELTSVQRQQAIEGL